MKRTMKTRAVIEPRMKRNEGKRHAAVRVVLRDCLAIEVIFIAGEIVDLMTVADWRPIIFLAVGRCRLVFCLGRNGSRPQGKQQKEPD